MTTQEEYIGFWSLSMFTLNQAFIKKHLGKPISKIFSEGASNKTSFWTGTTAVNLQH